MKHQYFGDIIDLFKYDLLETLSKNLNLNGITFVPMLTQGDEGNDGNKRNYIKAQAGTNNEKLISFLQQFEERNTRDAREIKKHFNSINIEFNFFSEDIFINKKRDAYFLKVHTENFKNQILFFDPDNGLEVKWSNHKHIKYNEIKSCFDKIDEDSILCVIQFRHRVNWKDTIRLKLERLKEKVCDNVTFVANNNIVFFILTKTEKRLHEVESSLLNYKFKNTLLTTK